jgi:antitoxin component YwqK of YwqJK toxin-antitoxin module
MKPLILTTISILIFYSCKQSDKKIIEKWGNGNPKITLDFKSVKDSTYTRTEYFENEKVKSTQDFVNAKLNGKLVNYSDKGFKQQEFDYVDGRKNGIGTGWYESGKVAFQLKYKDDLYYDGTEYFEDGWPRVLVKFSAPGKREGKAFYYEEDGNIWMQGYFKNGKEDSIWTKFDKNGQVTETTKYENGQMIKDAE